MIFRNEWKYSINAKTFDNVDPSLFRNFRFCTLFNYIVWSWGLTLLKVALFVSDVYTCIKLLAYNSWSSNIIQPYLPFRISKWLFSGCILASIVLLIWETISGIRIYRTRNIALTYINDFSRTAYSLSNYNFFCVLNKISPTGAYQKVAFYTFFEIKSCIRLLFTDTPRQVINGLTLWSVLVTVKPNSSLGDLESFDGLIAKIRTIAQTNHEEAVLLSFMLFSFIIWAFFISRLVLALLCSVYVYYKLINKHRHSGLREFVCVTISRNIDALVERKRKKLANLSNKSTATFEEYQYAFNNDSSAELLNQHPTFSRTSTNDLEAQKEKIEDEFNETTKPIEVTSAIKNSFEPVVMESVRPLMSTESLVRPRPPPISTKHSFESEKICTPTRAHTRIPFPQRNDSLLERRERIANEDYEHYTRGNK